MYLCVFSGSKSFSRVTVNTLLVGTLEVRSFVVVLHHSSFANNIFMFMSSFKWGRGATGSSGVDAVGCNGGGVPFRSTSRRPLVAKVLVHES